jgi:hypothetical protein
MVCGGDGSFRVGPRASVGKDAAWRTVGVYDVHDKLAVTG